MLFVVKSKLKLCLVLTIRETSDYFTLGACFSKPCQYFHILKSTKTNCLIDLGEHFFNMCIFLGRIGEKNILWLLYSMFCKKGFDFSRMLDHFSKWSWAIEINREFTFVEATYAIWTWDMTFH